MYWPTAPATDSNSNDDDSDSNGVVMVVVAVTELGCDNNKLGALDSSDIEVEELVAVGNKDALIRAETLQGN